MDKITQCYICKSTDVEPSQFLDYDDEKDVEIEREGYVCNKCFSFHYEENDRIICIINSEKVLENNGDNVKNWLPEIN